MRRDAQAIETTLPTRRMTERGQGDRRRLLPRPLPAPRLFAIFVFFVPLVIFVPLKIELSTDLEEPPDRDRRRV